MGLPRIVTEHTIQDPRTSMPQSRIQPAAVNT